MTTLRYSVIAVFGPTASGSRTSRTSSRPASHRGRLRRRTAGVQGLPILTNQSPYRRRLTAIRSLSATMSVGSTRRSHTRQSTSSSRRAAAPSWPEGQVCTCVQRSADLSIPNAVPKATRARFEEMYDADPLTAHAHLGRLDPAAAAVVHVNDRRRVVRALELADSGSSLVPATDELWSGMMRHPTLVVGLDLPQAALAVRIRERTQRMIAGGAADEARAAMSAQISRTAAKALGLVELTTLPPDEAAERIEQRTRQYAAYQRKWMRRIPGIELVEADRPATEVADAILDLARAR